MDDLFDLSMLMGLLGSLFLFIFMWVGVCITGLISLCKHGLWGLLFFFLPLLLHS